jgi:hypothetical protein
MEIIYISCTLRCIWRAREREREYYSLGFFHDEFYWRFLCSTWLLLFDPLTFKSAGRGER